MMHELHSDKHFLRLHYIHETNAEMFTNINIYTCQSTFVYGYRTQDSV